MAGTGRNFLDISSVDANDLHAILERAEALKADQKTERRVQGRRPLDGRVLAMIFDKPSTRTRVSFDVAMRQLGGETIVLSGAEMQTGRGESIADTAHVLSRYVDAIMIRTTDHERLTELAEHATVPVINGLTDASHPCQIMADIMTVKEHLGSVKGRKLAWSGDGNNVLNSLIEGAARFGYELDAAVPEGHMPDEGRIDWASSRGGKVHVHHDADAAAADADCVITDTWSSMGFEENAAGHNTFLPYQVNSQLMAKAKEGALFLHCLPAHRGEEVTAEVIDGPQSVVFDEAENRLHAQKSILAWCFGLDTEDE